MAMTVEVDIAVVGGGLCGLALAVGLQERGFQVHVFEKAPKVRAHSGTVISVLGNGTQALEGIRPELSLRMRREGCDVRVYTAFMRPQGEEETVERVLDQLLDPGRSFVVPWRSAQKVLMEELADPDLVHWGHRFLDYTLVEGGVEARFEVESKQGVDASILEEKLVRARLLVGADGMRSQVRKRMVGDEPRDLLLTTWNAIVPTDTIRSLNLHEKCEMRHINYTSRRITLYLMDGGSGYSLWQVRAPDESGEIAQAYESDLKTYGRDARKMRVLKQIKGIEELSNVKAAIEGTDPNEIREARSLDRLPLTSWHDASGQIVLVGDAAHGMYTGPAQGAQTAFEDAHQLSMLLHEALGCSIPEMGLVDVIKRFEAIRSRGVTRSSLTQLS